MDTQQLHALVHTLSDQETVYCMENARGNVLKLFKILKKTIICDENAIVTQMNLAAIYDNTLKELEDLLLSLANLQQTNPQSKVVALLEKSQWLFDKRQYHLCISLLNQAKSVAEKFGFLNQLVSIVELEHNLEQLGVLVTKQSTANDYIYYSDLADNYNQYLALKFKLPLMSLTVHNPASRRADFYLLEHKLLQNDSCPKSIVAKFLYYEIKSKLYFMLENYEQAATNMKGLFRLYENNPHYLELRPEVGRYITAMSNFVKLKQKLNKNIDDAIDNIKWFRNLGERFGFIDKQGYVGALYVYSYSQEVDFYYQFAEFDKILALIPEVTAFFKDEYQEVALLKKYMTYNFFAKTLFINEFYKEALKWVDYILKKWQKQVGSDLKADAMLLKMIIYLELENYTALRNTIIEIQQYFTDAHRRIQHEQLTLELFKAIAAQPNADRILEYQNYRLWINAVIEEEFTKHKSNMFDIVSWIDSKLENRPLIDILKEIAAKKEK